MSTALSQPLLTIFKDEAGSPNERTNAVIVLAEQNQEDPEFLANLILETNPVQFAVVLAKIQKQREACVPLLKDVLAEPIGPGWKYPDSSGFAATTADDLKQIQAASGQLTPRFAFCQKMPLDSFRQFAPDLATKGYRPISFRPFRQGDEVLVAAVWQRDRLRWAINYGATAEELQQDHEAKTIDGLWPIDLGHWQSTRGPFAIRQSTAM